MTSIYSSSMRNTESSYKPRPLMTSRLYLPILSPYSVDNEFYDNVSLNVYYRTYYGTYCTLYVIYCS